jgi:hypothetical protein
MIKLVHSESKSDFTLKKTKLFNAFLISKSNIKQSEETEYLTINFKKNLW